MDIFTRRKKLQGISVHSVFTWKEKSQGISVDSTNDGNNCTTKKVSWNQTERQTDLLCEFLRRNTNLNYPLMFTKNKDSSKLTEGGRGELFELFVKNENCQI